jgi:hypothetical protein
MLADPGALLLRLLQADADVMKLAGPRMYARIMTATSQFPLLVYTRRSTEVERTLAGPTRIERPQYGIEVWAKTAPESTALAMAVRGALDGFAGMLDGTRLSITLLNHQEIFDQGTLLHSDQLEFQVVNETMPS